MSVSLVSQLAGFGHYLPSNRIDNAHLEYHFHLAPGWIESRTAIKARRWVDDNELLVDLAERAAMAALENAAIPCREIHLTILATSTPDHLLPPTSPRLVQRLGLSHSGAYDLSGACCGFLYALVMADGFVRTQAKPVLVVAANILSRRINFSEPGSAVLFGDAAAAVVMIPSSDQTKGLLGVHFATDGSAYDLVCMSAGGSQKPFSKQFPLSDYKMSLRDGPAVFMQAMKMMTRCASIAMKNAYVSPADIQHFIPHQANGRMSENIARKLGIPLKKTISILDEYANSSSAGIPLALSISNEASVFISGEKILLTAAGAGMTAGAVVIGV